MNISFYIARRHLFAKKSKGIINIISMISMVVVAFVSAAMIVVMSAFNGIDDLVKSLFSNFDTPLTILPKEGKMFSDDAVLDTTLNYIDGIAGFSRVIEEDAWLNYIDHNAVATIKGVDTTYLALSPIDSMIYEGEFVLHKGEFDYAVVGLAVRSELYMPIVEGAPTVMNINAPIRGRKISRDKENAFNRESINVSGIFSVNAELDAKYVMVPLHYARSLFGMEDQISSIEIFLKDESQTEEIKAELEKQIPDSLRIQTRYEKNALVYKTNASEKWATFSILLFILLIACFNIVAALTMLIIEKKKDIFTLASMGARYETIVRIFMFEGVMINLIGAVIGTSLGVILCYAQKNYGFISMDGAMVNSYPVSIHWSDVIGIFSSVVFIGSLFSVGLVRVLMRRFASNSMR